MDPIAIIIGVILAGAAVWFVFRPFGGRQRLASRKTTETLPPPRARTGVISALRDLDFDYRTGKVNEEDYAGLRGGLLEEAARYVQAEADKDDRLEAMVRAHKVAAAHARPCPECGKKLSSDAQFCPQCGAKLAAVAACPSCGKQVQAGDFFCRSCGSKLEHRVEAAA